MTKKTIYIARDEREASLNHKATIASDYASIDAPNGASLYYGYEVLHAGQWCFRAQFVSSYGAQRDTIIPFSELGASDQFDVSACLLEGIAKLFERGAIAFTE